MLRRLRPGPQADDGAVLRSSPRGCAATALAFGAMIGGVLGVALLVAVLRSGWLPWIVAALALALITLLITVPLSLVALAVALVVPQGRAWLGDQTAQALERRHAVRLVSARRVPHQQHVHVLRDREEPPHLDLRPRYRELPERVDR